MGGIRSSSILGWGSILFAVFGGLTSSREVHGARPNIILCMADDLGWGDTGYNGHPAIKTPNLDRMAEEGIRFDRFYSAAPVCSPTRGSCLTGRHPFRYGILSANVGYLPQEEITLAEILKDQGYTTGHFGKWHLGTLTTKEKDSNRGRPNDFSCYSPPWENGFEVCFSTEAKVPTWDPMEDPDKPGKSYGTSYWSGPDQKVTENLEGDDARVILDRAIPFIRKAVERDQPFLAVIWFHTPHSPVVAGPNYVSMYPKEDEDHAHYYGCITAMDEQIGRLRKELSTLGIAGNTMLWFCSDNGPAGIGGGTDPSPGGRQQGSPGPFRGRKGSLYEGGIRVPGLLVWPGGVSGPHVIAAPCVTTDYFPTILDALGVPLPISDNASYDGTSLLPILTGENAERPGPIAFEFNDQIALSDNKYKILSSNKGVTYELFDLLTDPSETNDLSMIQPDRLTEMRTSLDDWRETRDRNGNR